MPVSDLFEVAKGGFTTLAGQIDNQARAGVNALRRQLAALSSRVTTVEDGATATTWTPTITGVTAGAAVVDANYTRVGDLVVFQFSWTFGAGSAVTGPVTVTLPVEAAETASFHCTFLDAGTTRFQGSASVPAGSDILPVLRDTGSGLGNLSSTVPMTWAAGDQIVIGGAYLT